MEQERNEKVKRMDETKNVEKGKETYPNRYKGELSPESMIVEKFNPTYPSRYKTGK